MSDTMTSKPYSVRWENGVTTSLPTHVATKPDAFAYLDHIMRSAEYPASMRVSIHEGERLVWLQHGTHVEVNA